MSEVGYKKPPIHTRFPVNRPPKPHTQKHPNGYLTPILKKLLNKEITIKDEEIKQILETKSHAKLYKILALRWILNGIQGENHAIKEIFDRVDGKSPDTMIDQSTHYTFKWKDRNESVPLLRKEADTKDLVR